MIEIWQQVNSFKRRKYQQKIVATTISFSRNDKSIANDQLCLHCWEFPHRRYNYVWIFITQLDIETSEPQM